LEGIHYRFNITQGENSSEKGFNTQSSFFWEVVKKISKHTSYIRLITALLQHITLLLWHIAALIQNITALLRHITSPTTKLLFSDYHAQKKKIHGKKIFFLTPLYPQQCFILGHNLVILNFYSYKWGDN
jgi:cell division protein FtsB